ncbi:hypothetical protein H6F43_04250 [Leptolyngbya sp. FACHB-36]|uniref:single-stranded DNA-binding protein n=1 Tax=Leptolyngbya sp. FACHB-36 TaxID=2692808 RepID=UPI0016805C1C|nr:single-stranded DNA-binding protein [Leptolyngbya sp. FACHB-36]MBD2019395.1 hypothetical protein [Leptolyngbya sp. FACHB-36]
MLSPEQFKQYLAIEQAKLFTLERIAVSLERMAPTDQKAPSWTKPLSDFLQFDWASIGATVVSMDDSGPSIVEWNGKQFYRRSPNNRFGEAIWFSRSIGEQDSEGKTIYERLVTFKLLTEVEPIPNKVNRAIEFASKSQQINPKTNPAAVVLKEDLSHLISLSDFHLARLGWDKDQGREYLEKTYRKRSRQQLTDEELADFVERLSRLPSNVPTNVEGART